MDSATTAHDRRRLIAYTLPMAVFLAGLALVSASKWIGGAFWLASSEYWVFPLQTIACGALVFGLYRREYQMQRIRNVWFVLAIAAAVFVLWISPQAFFGFAPRIEGFNPNVFAHQPALCWTTLGLRFLRLALVVPFVEEIFWRGFLLRYFIDERFDSIRVGAFSWLSFIVVTIGFTLVHSMPDWPAAAVTGALYNCVAYRTKSLTSCILAHAVTNLLLGLWIAATGQWGFW